MPNSRSRLSRIPLLAALAAALAGPTTRSEPVAPVGFLEAVLVRSVLARIEDRARGDFELTMLPARLRVEVVQSELAGHTEVRALLPDGRTAWVPPGDLAAAEQAATLVPDELRARDDDRAVSPLGGLPPGVSYRFLYRRGARLHVVVADLAKNPGLELAPFATAQYDQGTRGDERVAPIAELARRAGALVAMNGPFFVPSGRERGKPLGALVANKRVVWDVEDPQVLARHRSYLAQTDQGRFVMGETAETAEAILRKNRQDAFDRERLAAGERIVSLIGGLGRLVADGDPGAWRLHAGYQFAESYYGRSARRPQAVIGLSAEGRRLHLLIQEGYPHSERCFTLPELGHVLADLGATEVAFSDGGGSAELVVRGRGMVRTEGSAPRRPNSSILALRVRPVPGGGGAAREQRT